MNELAVQNKNVGLSAIGTLDDMKKKLQENKEKRDFIKSFIDEIFQENVDFGRGIDNSNAKPVLLLPGAEKLCTHFNIHPEWTVDIDTFEMLGRPDKTICYICYLIDNSTGQRIGEGRGACVIGEKSLHTPARDTNGSIKIAKKRAHVDAVKNAFGISERFTQDMDAVKSFLDEKNAMFSYVMKYRAGCESSMTDVEFVRMVSQREIHKKTISTMAELKLVVDSIDKYDPATGDRFPDDKG
jgi:hypothetical protein